MFVQTLSPSACPTPQTVPGSASLWGTAPVALLLQFSIVWEWSRVCTGEGLPHCWESRVQSVTLAEAQGSRLASSIPEPRAALPAPSQCHIAVGAAQALLAALCRWGSAINTIDVIAPSSRQAT